MTTLVYADGGCKDWGTEDSYAYGSFWIPDIGMHRLTFDKSTTSQEAEYKTLIECLQELIDLRIRDASIMMDSRLVIEQTSGRWRIREERLKKLCDLAKRKLSEAGATLSWISNLKIKEVLGH